MESSKESHKIVTMSRGLTAKGFLVLRYDFAGVGESSGCFGKMTYTGQARDLEAAVRYMKGLGVRALGIIGSSMGGSAALLYTGYHAGVSALAVLAAPADPKAIVGQWFTAGEVQAWRKKGYLVYHGRKIYQSFLEDIDRIDILRAAGNLSCPLLVLHGEQDGVVPVGQAHALYRSATGTKALRIFPDADHRFSDPADLKVAMGACEDWMSLHVTEDPVDDSRR